MVLPCQVEPVDRVLLVRVSVVARPTKVSVAVGKVKVPVLTMVENEGEVREGESANTRAPEPVSLEMLAAKTDEVAKEVKFPEASVKTTRETVKSGRLTMAEPESRTKLPVVEPPRVSVCMAVLAKVGVPYKVKAPEMVAEDRPVNTPAAVKGLLMVVVPVEAPMLSVVAAPPK